MELRSDFETVQGTPFQHFYCPILFRDEQALLCKAHIVNKALPCSPRRWTLQRQDVDSFFGQAFESDFVDIELPRRGWSEAMLVDKKLSKRLRPKVFLDDKPIEHYVTSGPIPPNFSPFALGHEPARLVLKMNPDDTLAAAKRKWEIRVEKDLRLPAVVSLLKAAHLTMFDMLGYRYALSAGGCFLGLEVLGRFFLNNSARARSDILANARVHFTEFRNMVRPSQSGTSRAKGTVADRLLYICTRGTEIKWAFLVLVRTGTSRHAVLVPIMENEVAAAHFLAFLKNDEERIEAHLTKFDPQRGWMASPQSTAISWPKAGVSFS